MAIKTTAEKKPEGDKAPGENPETEKAKDDIPEGDPKKAPNAGITIVDLKNKSEEPAGSNVSMSEEFSISGSTCRVNDYERLSFYEGIFQQAKEATLEGDYNVLLEQHNDESDNERSMRFTDFERLGMIGVLNEMIDKLSIIGADKPKAKPNLNFHPPKVRYHDKLRKTIYDIETNAHTVQEEGIIRISKFQRERTLLEVVLKLTRDELFENSSIDALNGYLNLEDKQYREETAISAIHEQYSNVIQTLNKTANESEQHTKQVLLEQAEMVNKIEGDLQNNMFHYGLKLGYNRKWQEARLEQNIMKIQKEEQSVKQLLKDTKQKLANEERVHRDVMLYLQMSIIKLNKDIESWTKRYNRDVEQKDLDIANLKRKKIEEAERMSQMLKTYVTRNKEINQYLAERTAREEAAAIAKAELDAALKIQSWWRGTMVRWKLGQYAGEKKKKKKAKDKAKK